MTAKYKYMLHTWGGFFNNEFKDVHKEESGYEFFDSMEDLEIRLNHLKEIEKRLNARSLAFAIKEGFDVILRTVVVLDFRYKDADYHIEYDFGYGYEEDTARYMFEDGNYACDCNRSRIIKRFYPDFPLIRDCGGDIKMLKLDVVFKD